VLLLQADDHSVTSINISCIYVVFLFILMKVSKSDFFFRPDYDPSLNVIQIVVCFCLFLVQSLSLNL